VEAFAEVRAVISALQLLLRPPGGEKLRSAHSSQPDPGPLPAPPPGIRSRTSVRRPHARFFSLSSLAPWPGTHVGEIYSSARPLKSRPPPPPGPIPLAPLARGPSHTLRVIIATATRFPSSSAFPFGPLSTPLSAESSLPPSLPWHLLLPGMAVHILFSESTALTICSGVM